MHAHYRQESPIGVNAVNRRRRRLRPVMEPLESRLMLAMSRLVEPPVIIIPKAPIYAIGANAGQPPEVKVSDPVTGEQVSRFFAYDPRSRGGVNVAVADVNGDGVY